MEIESLSVILFWIWIGGMLILASIGLAFTIMDAAKASRDE